MQFTLTIDCDGAAFHDPTNDEFSDGPNDEYRRRQEVARLLQVAAVRVGVHADDQSILLDVFGRNVGSYDFRTVGGR